VLVATPDDLEREYLGTEFFYMAVLTSRDSILDY
jgi:hypothetical protein